jgi:hypothetical protein
MENRTMPKRSKAGLTETWYAKANLLSGIPGDSSLYLSKYYDEDDDKEFMEDYEEEALVKRKLEPLYPLRTEMTPIAFVNVHQG